MSAVYRIAVRDTVIRLRDRAEFKDVTIASLGEVLARFVLTGDTGPARFAAESVIEAAAIQRDLRATAADLHEAVRS